ncbi:interleukin-11 [Trichomycterus rosablanca]|uniref:interleukin-11 n=1 Tax=Trichomycterus rosablanca TaxID=2290929 RepID=UPI002F35E772
MAYPTSTRHKDGLTGLCQQMHQLLKLVQRVRNHFETDLPIEHHLTSLPTIHHRPQDLERVEEHSTLSQLSSGLHSFKLHYDWLVYWQDELGLELNIEELIRKIQYVSILVQKQTNESTPQTTLPPLPSPTSAWDLYKTSAVIRKKLQHFCDWYVRALRFLRHRRQ